MHRSLRQTIFTRLILHAVVALGVLLVAAGVMLDRYLSEREINRLEGELERAGRAAEVLLGKEGLQLSVQELGKKAGLRYTVIRRDGIVLADSSAKPETMDNHAARPEIAKALQGQRGSSQRTSPTLSVGMLYVAIPTDPVIRVAKPVEEVNLLLQQIRRRIVYACIPAFLLAIGLAAWLAFGLKRRLGRMEQFAKKLAEGSYEDKLPVQGSDELGGLEASLDTLRLELASYIDHLNEDRVRLISLLNGIPDAVLLFDEDSRLAAANSVATDLFSIGGDEAIGRHSSELIRHPEILGSLDSACLENIPESEPLTVYWDDNRVMSVSFHCVEAGKGEKGTLALLRDVTRQAHLEKVRTDFIANMAHELRTPLTALRGASETIMSVGKDRPEMVERFLGTIHRHAVRLGNSLADISQLAKIESGHSNVVPEAHDAREVVNAVVELFDDPAARAGITVEKVIPEVPVMLVSDKDQLESILVNLVQNSVRYTPEGGTVTVSVEQSEDGSVAYKVSDTGIGIPPKDLPRVTERFYRVDPGRSRESGGTGLGLSIVKHLATQLEGEFEIESEYGKGTTVVVTIPAIAGK